MEWYRVLKTIHGRGYWYWQKTYRQGDSVKTLNKYIGPANRMIIPTSSPSPLKHCTPNPPSVMEANNALMMEMDWKRRASKPLFFCKRCEKQTADIDREGKCVACREDFHFIKQE